MENTNAMLLEELKDRLVELGCHVDRHPKYLALLVNSELEIATAIIDNPDYHPDILHLMIAAIHATYFPNGIIENIVGIGKTIQAKINSVLDNYINTTFLPIIDGFSDSHYPDFDFYSTINGKEILWHPKLGNLGFQGQWNEHPQNEVLFKIVKDKLKNQLTQNKINWLKLYVSKQMDGTIGGESLFNNEPWEDGLIEIKKYAESWEKESDFLGIKQFIVFRRCDIYDE